MENEERDLAERFEAATTLLDKTLNWLEERLTAASALSGEVERISATVEQSRREEELAGKLTAAERELGGVEGDGEAPWLEPAAQDGTSGDHGDAGQARHRGRPGGRAHPGCSPERTEPGAAHRRENAAPARRSDRVEGT